MLIIGRFLCLFIIVVLGVSLNTSAAVKKRVSGKNQFDFQQWKKSSCKKIDIKNWSKYNPSPWSNFFDEDKEDCAKRWYVNLGPLGISTLMHDRSWYVMKGCREIYPKFLCDKDGAVFNAFEVLDVKPGAPSNGKLQKGDLIVAIDGKSLKTSQQTLPEMELGNRSCRGLEMNAGLLIDQAEGRGRIRLSVLRIPTNKKKSLGKLGNDLRRWRTVQKLNEGAFNIHLEDIDQLIFKSSAKKGVRLNKVFLVNEDGYKVPVISSAGRRTATLLNNPLDVPYGKWMLTGELQLNKGGSIELQVTKTGALPKSLLKFVKEVEIDLPQIGSFGSSFNPNSAKVRNYSQIIASRLAVQQEEDGSWKAGGYATNVFPTSICALALMSTGDPAYQGNIRKAAYYVANGPWSKWAYPYGLRLTFLAEYYLRTKDKGILPALKFHLAESHRYILADYTAGHSNKPGYGGYGYIGAGGMIACGLAVASHTPAASFEDKVILDKMLERVQQIAPKGKVPYGRGYKGDTKKELEEVEGQGGSCGTGPYFFASLIRGGAKHFTKMAARRYGQGPWGSGENGHATQTIHFVWACLAAANCGSKALLGNMNAYLWKFTTLREYDGFINKNNYRVEYHSGDAVLGRPYWRTAGYLLIMNAYKRNLAITGNPKYRAKSFRNVPLLFHQHQAAYKFIERNWFLAEAVLYPHVPKSLKSGIDKLRALKRGENLGNDLRKLLKSHAPVIARDILNSKVSHNLNRGQLAELILGVGFEAACTPNYAEDLEEEGAGASSKGLSKKERKDAMKKKKKEVQKGNVENMEYKFVLRPISMINKVADEKWGGKSPGNGLLKFKDVKMTVKIATKIATR